MPILPTDEMVSQQSGSETYYQVRWAWWKWYEVEALLEAFQEFQVTRVQRPEPELGMGKATLPIVKTKADTLYAYLARQMAVLFQRQAQPLTEKDIRLKNIVFKLYNHNWSTPLFR